MGYADMFAYHVLPVVRARRLPDGKYALGDWVGAGFTFGDGTFVTCWHCVGAELDDDEVYLAASRTDGLRQTHRDWGYELHRLGRDVSGSDLALAQVGFTCEPHLKLAIDPLEWGEDVIAFGFPHTLDTRNPETGDKRIETHARVFKGHVTRLFYDEYQRDLVVELAMPAPVGMSGGPLMRVQQGEERGFECVGVVFGEHQHQTPDGELRVACAVRLDTLRNAAAGVTGGVPLAEYLARQPDR